MVQVIPDTRRRRRSRAGGARLGLVLLTLTGCRSVPLAEEDRRSLSSVAIAESVEANCDVSGPLTGVDTRTRGSVWYATWITAPVGVVYDLVDWSENRERRERSYRALLARQGVDAPAIAREALRGELDEAGVFPRIGGSAPDARIHLRIDHGLDDGWGLRGSWKPWFDVEAVLRRPGGEVLWKQSASISASDDRTPQLLRPVQRPERLRAAYVRAARLAARELVTDLRP